MADKKIFKKYLREGDNLFKVCDVYRVVGESLIEQCDEFVVVPQYELSADVMEGVNYQEYKTESDQVFEQLSQANDICDANDEALKELNSKIGIDNGAYNVLLDKYEEYKPFLDQEDVQDLEETVEEDEEGDEE